MAKIIGYARVSSREQFEDSNALEQQMARLRLAGAEEILSDVVSGRGGKESKRSSFQRLLKLVESESIDKVIVTRLDRLSRSLLTLRTTVDLFAAHDVALVALDEQIDMGTAAGKFQMQMLGALAEMESDRMSERIRHGKEYFRQQLKTSHPPFGYRTIDQKLVLADEPWLCTIVDRREWSQAEAARWQVDEYLQRRSLHGACSAFAEKFGYQRCWPAGLKIWITSPVIRGHRTYHTKSKKPQVHYNTHDALISEETYRAVADTIALNRRIGGFGAKRAYQPLSGLVRCHTCGKNQVIANSSGQPKYYCCSAARVKKCPNNKHTRIADLESAVIDALIAYATEIAEVSADVLEHPGKTNPELQSLKEQLDALKKLGYNPAIEEAKIKLMQQIAAIDAESIALPPETPETKQELLASLADRGFWDALDRSQYREIFHATIESVTPYPDGHFQIEWRF